MSDKISELKLCRTCDLIGHGCQNLGDGPDWHCPQGYNLRHLCEACGDRLAMEGGDHCATCAAELATEKLAEAVETISKLTYLTEGRDALIPHMDKLCSGSVMLQCAANAADNSNEAAKEIAAEDAA